ncbi:MAG: AraC family transcriptional regulator [Lachnospiraceae bacterium]|nr:AraC family transcriptional regulator [Lachnospiraceae bacterium]
MAENFKNSFKAPDKELVSLSVYNVGYQKCTPGYQWGPGIRDHFLIHHVISGTGYYQTGQASYTLQAGDSFLIYPNTESTYFADQQDPWEYAWVGFTGSDAPSILQSAGFSREHPFRRDNAHSSAIARQLLQIYEVRGSSFAHSVEMTGRLYTALALFMKTAPSQPRKDTCQTYAQKGIEYILANYSYPITIEDVASYVGISRSHLFRCFQAAVGKSPKDYLTELRIRQACILLKQSDLSVTAIANSVGFDSSLYFSKAFHRAKGMSPSSYAKDRKETNSYERGK